MTTRYRRGFTLLELSVVLVIISLITGMAISSGISAVSSARYTATQQKMKTISDALMAYRTANDRLPCPGDLTLPTTSRDYGLEAGADGTSAIGVGTGVCTGSGMVPQANFTASGATNTIQSSAEGSFPAISLGLPTDLMVDGWGNSFRYAVDISMTQAGIFASTPLGCGGNAITVNDVNGNARSQNSVYALISHGPNGHGAYTKNGAIVNAGSVNANELINCHCNSSGVTTTSSGVQTSHPATYVQADASLDPTNALDSFDDMVVFKERWQMGTDWDVTGKCVYTYVYVLDPPNNRVEIFTTKGKYVSQFPCSSGTCTAGNGSNQYLNFPSAWVTVDKSGNVWVADTYDYRVAKYSATGTYLNVYFTVPGLANSGQYGTGGGMAVDANGNLWISDNQAGVVEYDTSGNYIARLCSNTYNANPLSATGCSTGSGNGYMYAPTSVAFDSQGHLWVLDNQNNNQRLQEFNVSAYSSSPYMTQFSANGALSMVIDSSNNIWIDTPYGAYLEELSSTNGSVLKTFYPSTEPWQPTYLNYIISFGGMAFDKKGNLWVGDINNNYIVNMTTSGTKIGTYGSAGNGNGQFNSSGHDTIVLGIGR